MKNRTSLVLMEQLVMVLVFALAASVCLRAFARADRIATEISRQDRAVYLAQNGAETLKACGGDFDETARLLGGTVQGDRLTVSYDENWNRTESAGACRLEIEKTGTQTPGLGQAQVRVLGSGGEALFSLDLAWQEVD
ncbi:MAG: hypothetical protein J6J18_01310 [Oscillospiraceae bacterium]|nr:hypothetical protein [Oscillospiraceae bacterium]